jgi:hypothetical protein
MCHPEESKRECQDCHRAQAQLYAGQVADLGLSGDPDVMANAGVGSIACHDLKKKGDLCPVRPAGLRELPRAGPRRDAHRVDPR